jgi:hypothetical protein
LLIALETDYLFQAMHYNRRDYFHSFRFPFSIKLYLEDITEKTFALMLCSNEHFDLSFGVVLN